MVKGTVRLTLCSLAVAGLVLASAFHSAEAKPPYNAAFLKTYPALEAAAKEAKCGVCHIGPPKAGESKWNDYGTAMGKLVPEEGGKKKTLMGDAIIEALKKVEKEKSGTEGKTFGDLIKDGKLPGKA